MNDIHGEHLTPEFGTAFWSLLQQRALTALTHECPDRFRQLYAAYRDAGRDRSEAQSQAKMQLAREYRGFYRTLRARVREELLAVSDG